MGGLNADCTARSLAGRGTGFLLYDGGGRKCTYCLKIKLTVENVYAYALFEIHVLCFCDIYGLANACIIEKQNLLIRQSHYLFDERCEKHRQQFQEEYQRQLKEREEQERKKHAASQTYASDSSSGVLKCINYKQKLNIPTGKKLKVSCPTCKCSWLHDGTINFT